METSPPEENQLSEPLIPTAADNGEEGEAGMNEDCSNAEALAGGAVAQEDGFDRPDLHATNGSVDTPWYKCPMQLVAMLSNYSTSYNVVNIAMVIPILEKTIPDTTADDTAASASSLLAGMMAGQLLGGYLGDSPVLGRLGALQVVVALQVIASVACASLWTHLSRDRFYVLLATFRFLLGVGAGGVYPLAAVLSAEQGESKEGSRAPQGVEEEESEESKQKQAHRVVLTFSTQGLGFITAPLVTSILLYMTTNLEIIWRIILAAGSLPGLLLLSFQWWIHRKDSHVALPLEEDFVEDEVVAADTGGTSIEQGEIDQEVPLNLDEQDSDGVLLQDMQRMEEELREAPSRWETIRSEPNLVQKLLGTAGTWFLFDVLFYGNTLFQPIVIEAAFGSSKKGSDDGIAELREMAVNSLILTSIALPGYAVAGIVIGKRMCCILQSPKYVMMQGFCAMSALYLAIGLNWTFLKHTPALLVLLYGMTFFFANYGPNTSTFILPSLVFSPTCRTTLNGVSAAAGKLGALTGATLFEPVAEKYGDAHVMCICSAIAILAFLMTFKFVQMHPSDDPSL